MLSVSGRCTPSEAVGGGGPVNGSGGEEVGATSKEQGTEDENGWGAFGPARGTRDKIVNGFMLTTRTKDEVHEALHTTW